MKLYDTPLAPNPRRVRWFMAEKAITDIEVVTLNLMEGQHKTPEYLRKAGLANVASVGINLAGYSVLVPERRTEIVGMVWKAMLAGFLATCLTASIVGLLPAGLFG